MAWNPGVTRTTGDIVTAADWNSFLGAGGSLMHLHQGLHNPTAERPSRSGADNRTMTLANPYQAGTVRPFFNGSRVPLTASGSVGKYVDETVPASGIFEFTTKWRDELNAEKAIVTADIIEVSYLISQ